MKLQMTTQDGLVHLHKWPWELALVLTAGITFINHNVALAQIKVAAPAQVKPAIQPPPPNNAPGKPAEKKTYAPDPGQVWCVAYSPDGKRLAIATGFQQTQGTVIVWDVATGREIFRRGEERGLRCVKFSPDGKSLAFASYDGTVKLINSATGKQNAVLKGHKEGVNSIAFSPDGKWLATGSLDKTAKIWDLSTSKEKLTFSGHKECVLSIAFSPDGSLVATGSGNPFNAQLPRDAKIWSRETGKEKFTFGGQQLPVEGVAFSPNGKLVATLSWDGIARLWSVDTGREEKSIATNGQAMAARFSEDNKTIAIACNMGQGGEAKIFDVASGREMASFPHTGQVWTLDYSRDGRTLAVGCWDQKVHLWELASKLERATFFTLAGAAGPQTGPPPRKALTPQELESKWNDLAGADARAAYNAVLALAQSDKESAPFLKEHLLSQKDETIKPADPQIVTKLIADMDNDDADIRELATQKLQTLGRAAEARLREQLKGRTSAEVRIRLEYLLEKLPGAEAGTLRIIRAIEALEFSGSPLAQEALSALANDSPKNQVKAEAQASLDRLRTAK